jgi:NADH-quinone oxidoreductase subunit N
MRFLGVLFVAPDVGEMVAAYRNELGMVLALVAAATMTLGNLAALRQTSLKRMLAYSSVAHAGYVLVGIAAMNQAGMEASLFYLAAYYFMNLGAFGFLLYFSGVTGRETLESLRGMGPKAPMITVPMVIFLVSLTGLPPMVGFTGKLQLLYAAMAPAEGLQLGWLAVCLGLNSVISLYYYMRVVRALFLEDSDEPKPAPQVPMAVFLCLMAFLTVWYGLFFTPLLDLARSGMDLLT